VVAKPFLVMGGKVDEKKFPHKIKYNAPSQLVEMIPTRFSQSRKRQPSVLAFLKRKLVSPLPCLSVSTGFEIHH
jgi:hypothetical protein